MLAFSCDLEDTTMFGFKKKKMKWELSEEDKENLKKTKNELKKEREDHPGQTSYRIFRLEKDEKTGEMKQINMIRFWAKDDAEAYKRLKEYVKVANRKYHYFYDTGLNYIGPDGKRFDTMEDMLADHKREGLFEKIGFWFYCKKRLWGDRWFNLKEAWRRARHGHDLSESFGLDNHLVNDIIYNIPIILDNNDGCPQPFIDLALKNAGKSEEEAKKMMYEGYPDEIFEEAMKLLHEEINKMYLYARLYVYYSGYGIVDSKDEVMVEIDRKYRNTIPYVPGTYKRIDYRKLDVLVRSNWNKMWNWMQKNGHLLYT
jgi:hypothetical protein